MSKPAKPSGFLWLVPEARNVVCAAVLGDRWPQAKAALQELGSGGRKVLEALRRDRSNVDPALSKKLREAEIKANSFTVEGTVWLNDKLASGQLPQYLLETNGAVVPHTAKFSGQPDPPRDFMYLYRSRPTPITGVVARGSDGRRLLVRAANLDALLAADGLLSGKGVLDGKGGTSERRGRKPKWDWDGAVGYLLEVANRPDGLPEKQADIERLVARWFLENVDDEPVVSAIRKHVSAWCKEVLREASN